MEGVVKFFDDKKGFGFAKCTDGSGDVFIHYTEITMSGFKKLVEGQRVVFDVVDTPKGRKAQQVTPL